MVYKWKPGAHQKLDAQATGEHLEVLRETHGGLTARLVVDDAKAEDAPTHGGFEWDDAKAGDEWRLHQARRLMNGITVIVASGDSGAERETRAFVVVREDDQQHYSSIHAVMADPALKAQVLARAMRELESWRKKYRELEELADLFHVIDAARERVA